MDKIHQIHVTLDSHLKLHIANPFFWVNAEGQHPPPFTAITHEAIKNKIWVTTFSFHFAQPLEDFHVRSISFISDAQKFTKSPRPLAA